MRTHPPAAKFNGWTNWETWNVVLWIDNDQGLYNAKREFIRTTLLTVKSVEEFVREIFPNGTPDFDSGEVLSDVNFAEICEHWKDELE